MEALYDMSELENISYVRQDYESYSSLKLLYEGAARQLEPQFVGDIRLRFASEFQNKIIRFDWVSSVLYCDELLWSQASYPYFKDVDRTNGLFQVIGSSYLKRVQTMGANEPAVFLDHNHFIYFDAEFNWHITARGIEELDN